MPSALPAALAIPAQAAGWDPGAETRYGAFVGARIQVPLGAKRAAAPRAELMLAPTNSRISSNGRIETRIGRGFALDFAAKGKPALTLGGVRADRLIGISPSRTAKPEQKLGLSDGGKIAIGVGLVLLVGAGIWIADKVDDALNCKDEDGHPCD